MRKRRWLELIKDYDLVVHYHPSKVNVVADDLSCKAHCNCLIVTPREINICQELEKLGMEMISQGSLANLTIDSNLEAQIIVAQKEDKGTKYLKEKIANRAPADFKVDDAGVNWFKYRLVVPKVPGLRQQILDEAHTTRYSIHPGTNNMYQDLKQICSPKPRNHEDENRNSPLCSPM